MVTELRSFKGIVRIPASVRLWVTRWKLEATFGSNKLFLRQQSKFEQIGDAFDFVLTDSFCVAEAWGLCQGSEFFRWPGETKWRFLASVKIYLACLGFLCRGIALIFALVFLLELLLYLVRQLI